MKQTKKRLKKLLALALAGAMLFGLTACGGSQDNAEQGGQANGEKLQIGVIQMIDNGAFEDMREGFLQELQDKGYGDDQVEILYRNAQGDATNLNTICQEMVDSGVDLVATIATPATQAMVAMESDIPVVFISVSDPVSAGVLTDMEHPDKNATGTSNAIPISEIFGLSEQLTPGVQTYGILYCTSEVNSVSTAEQAKAYLDENGLHYVEKVVTNSSEVQQAAQSLVGSVDALFIPNDSVVQAAMPLVSEVARDAKIPVYGSSAVMVNSGALATVAITDTQIGAISADMAIQYLEGTAIADIPAQVVPADAILVNQTTADVLALDLDTALSGVGDTYTVTVVEDSAE